MAEKGGKAARQKMINLMYLVFIAMMAMNVDRQVLRSFEDITVTLDDSSKLTADNNSTFYDQIVNKAKDDPDYAAILDKSKEVKVESDKVFNIIEGIRQLLMEEQEYTLPDPNVVADDSETNYSSLSNSDGITRLLFTGKAEASESGSQLIAAMEAYKKFMVDTYPDQRDKNRINQIFDTSDKGNRSWLVNKFYEQPMVAGLANLTKIQSDIRTEEGSLVRTLLANKLQDEIHLKEFQPIVMVPPFIRNDKPADASIAFGAFDNTLQGSISIDGIGNVPLKDGKADFTINPSGSGKKTLSGTMIYMGPDGEVRKPFSQEYEVVAETLVEMPSGAVISADAMNVVYRNLENPISATVNGADGPVTMTASQPGLSGSNGKYVFKPQAGSSTVTFTASAKTSTGKTVNGSKEFRIKPVPPARGQIAGKTNIQVPANGLAGQTVRVDWPDFLFDVKGQVVSFNVKVPGQPTVKVDGDKMSAAAGALGKAKKGDAVGVFDIKYSSSAGPGTASPITIEVR